MNIGLTLFGQMITFFLFVLFTKKYVWPPIITVLETRKEQIAQGLAASTQAYKDLADARQSVSEQHKQASSQALQLLEEARQESARMIHEAQTKAEQEGRRLIKKAEAEIAQMLRQGKDDLKQEIGKIALFGAEKILSKQIDGAEHQRLLDSFVENL